MKKKPYLSIEQQLAVNAQIDFWNAIDTLKENIKKVGVSPQGYKIYEFNYKGSDVRFRGAMAQDVRLKNPMAVGINVEHMYLTVDYDKIDIDMEVV